MKVELEIVKIVCCNQVCGIPFFVETEYKDLLVSSKRNFCCPNGHSMNYMGESDKDKALRFLREKNQLEREKDIEIQRLKKQCIKKTTKKKVK